jgi:hypothetical protein
MRLTEIAITAIIAAFAKEFFSWLAEKLKSRTASKKTTDRLKRIFNGYIYFIAVRLLLTGLGVYGLYKSASASEPITRWVIAEIAYWVAFAWFQFITLPDAVFEYVQRYKLLRRLSQAEEQLLLLQGPDGKTSNIEKV